MPVPKSVTKINKDGVTYVSEVDKANYFIYELTRAALRDVGKFVTKAFAKEYYSRFQRRSGKAARATKYKVLSGKKTKYPRVEIGLPHASKKKEVDGFYSYFQEFGSSKTPKLGLIQKVVEGNTAEIVKIQSKYLSGIEDEALALSLIDEDEMEGNADDE